MCRIKTLSDESLAFPGCDAMWCSYEVRAYRKDNSYLSEFLFISFRFYLKNITFVYRIKAQLDESRAFSEYNTIGGFMRR